MLFFTSPIKKARESAKDAWKLTQKVIDYRKDVIPPGEVAKLEGHIQAIKLLLKDKSTTVEQIKMAENNLEPDLRKNGGSFYPKTFWAENTEVLLVAAILAIGIRSFFFQPFKIPTNSMYPSFNGMTAHVYEEGEEPFVGAEIFNFLRLGAKNYDLKAPASGDVIFTRDTRVVPGRKWFVLPTKKVQYKFLVGGEPVYIEVPLDFDMSWVLEPLLDETSRPFRMKDGTIAYRLNREAQAGETFLSFDLLTGDQLFVDRVRYHFVRPKVGDSIVFQTENIEHMAKGHKGKYYIKRAVAGPGDSLEIQPPKLILNGEKITGSGAFEKNAEQIENYPGYIYGHPSQNYPIPQADGKSGVIEIPDGYYFAMGDNSPQSADSRMWGFVPEREIIGTALFIYYPFSFRWGVPE